MRIAIVGAGGVGGYFGGSLAAAGADVTFVARGAHLEALRARGLRMLSDRDDRTVPVRATDAPGSIGPVDLVIVAVKLWDTEGALRSIAPLVSPRTAVLSLQNGVAKDDALREAFGADRVLGALCYIGATIVEPGVVKRTGALAKLVVGEFDGARTARLEEFAGLCRRAEIDVAESPDIARATWEKFVFLVGLSGATSVVRQPIGPIRANPRSRALLAALFGETVAVGRARGVGIDTAFASDRLAFCDTLDAAFTSSMSTDLARGNRLEAPWLQGVVSRLGAECGVPTPADDFVLDALAVYVDGAPDAPRVAVPAR